MINFDEKTLVTYNDPALVQSTLPALQAAAGKQHVVESNWFTYSEDFSYYATKAPSFFFYLGGMPKGNDPAKAPAHHTPDFYIDENGFDVGVKAFCEIVFNYASLKNK
jgi:amidohydrolase